MITTEKAFNEAFNLQEALRLVTPIIPKYKLTAEEQIEFSNLSDSIEYKSGAHILLEIIFTQKKHIEHLITLNKINSNEIEFVDVIKDIHDSVIPSNVKYALVSAGYKLIKVK